VNERRLHESVLGHRLEHVGEEAEPGLARRAVDTELVGELRELGGVFGLLRAEARMCRDRLGHRHARERRREVDLDVPELRAYRARDVLRDRAQHLFRERHQVFVRRVGPDRTRTS
jgi:hypothetical protein